MGKNTPVICSAAGTFSLGGTQKIHRLGYGAMRLTGPNIWGNPTNIDQSKAILRHAIDLGINFIDTADSYGPEISENIIADSLYPYPKDLVIATKGGIVRPSPEKWIPLGRPDYLMQCVEMSLRRLRLDCIDLYQLHCVDSEVPLEESLGALKKMQNQGKIRFIGLSNVSISEIERAKKIVEIVSIQNQYNVQYRLSESVVQYCEEYQLAFIPWYPLGSGSLATGHPKLQQFAKQKGVTATQLGLAWLLKHSPVMVPIPGTSNIEHLEENTAAARIELSAEEVQTIAQFF